MPNPPIKQLPPIRYKRKSPMLGVVQYLKEFETNPPLDRVVNPTPKVLKAEKSRNQKIQHEEELQPRLEEYRKFQRECGGEYNGMNCYNTLFVGRLAYEVTERKLLREMEAFGPVKDIKLVTDRDGKSRGYGFVEYDNEEDMKRSYRGADAMRIEGREIVVDVERGHTVPTWLPRRLGGGLGGTRLGGREVNVTMAGRFDPSRLRPPQGMMDGIPPMGDGPPPMGMGRGQGPPPHMMQRGGPSYYEGPPPVGNHGGRPPMGYGGPPPRGGGGGSSSGDRDRRRRRSRSRSPERGRYAPRSRY
jgi:U1 small nuclear ribonucleoprotein